MTIESTKNSYWSNLDMWWNRWSTDAMRIQVSDADTSSSSTGCYCFVDRFSSALNAIDEAIRKIATLSYGMIEALVEDAIYGAVQVANQRRHRFVLHGWIVHQFQRDPHHCPTSKTVDNKPAFLKIWWKKSCGGYLSVIEFTIMR